ncbi:MAG: class I SAM-dependent methyltransferase [Phycisphaerales bacterium]
MGRVSPEIRWEPSALDADPVELARAFNRSIHGLAKRMSPAERAKFLFALDSELYGQLGEAAIAASADGGDGLHPKHRLTRYHDYFAARIGAGDRVIDLGSGVGALAVSIATRTGAAVHGIDWDRKNVDKARAAAAVAGVQERCTFEVGDITGARAAGSFDVVVLSNVLEHIDRREERLAMWREWYRPARLLVRVPSFERDWRVPFKKELGVEWRCDPTHETEYTRDQLESELGAAGFTVRECTCVWGEYWCSAVAGS